MEDKLLQLAQEQTIAIAVGLWVIGTILAKVPAVANWIIPIVLLCVGTGAGVAMYGPTVDGALQGIIAAGVAVMADQLYKQVRYREAE